MQITKINNTSFKQTFMPMYTKYTDTQKKVADEINREMENYKPTEALLKQNRRDFLVSRLGSNNSLRVFNCVMEYNYSCFQYRFEDPIYIGKYDKNHPFKREDIDNALKSPAKNHIKAGIMFSLASLFTALGLMKLLRRI